MLIDSKYRIITTDGYQTDENDKLVEIVIPSTVETYQSPTKVTFMGENFNWSPSNASTLLEFEAPNITAISSGMFTNFTALRTVKFDNLTSLTQLSNNTGAFQGCTSLNSIVMPKLQSMSFINNYDAMVGGIFQGCTSLSSVYFPELLSIKSPTGAYGQNYTAGVFRNCTGLVSINMPKLQTIDNVYSNGYGGGCFYGCIALSEVSLPSVRQITGSSASGTIYNSCFYGCTGLTSVTLGSEGHPVTSIASVTFQACTQVGLTITVYTSGGAALSGEPWGATNATIVYEEA